MQRATSGQAESLGSNRSSAPPDRIGVIGLESVNRLSGFAGLPGEQADRHLAGRDVQQREAVLLENFAVRRVRVADGAVLAERDDGARWLGVVVGTARSSLWDSVTGPA